MDNNIEMNGELRCQNGASATVKSEDPLALDRGSQNEMFASQSDGETESNTVAPSDLQNKMEVKGDPWSQNGPSVAIKTEPEDLPVSDASVHNEMVYVSLSNTVIHSDEETDVKLEVKEEPWWHDVSCKLEDPNANVETEMKESVSDTEEILGDVPGEALRLSTELTCRNIDSATRGRKSDLKLGSSNAETSNFLNSTEPHIEETNIMSSYAETGSLIYNSKHPYKCTICEKSFMQLSQLEMHTISHKGKGVYKCETCGASFVCALYLKRHQLIHDKGEFNAAVCQKSILASKLEKQKLIHEGQRKHKCDICEKSFTRASGLKEHKLIHEGKRPYKCEVCEKSFTNTSTLKVHKLIHEGKRPHKCDVCEKTFTSSSNLKVHKLLHEGKRPHKCEVCEKTFIHATTYKNHKLIHEGKRPYICNICMKSFKRSSHLKKHYTLIHEGKRPYTCNICEKSFQQSSHLNQHYTVKHEGKRSYVCATCGKSYTRAAHLKRHTSIHEKAMTEASTHNHENM